MVVEDGQLLVLRLSMDNNEARQGLVHFTHMQARGLPLEYHFLIYLLYLDSYSQCKQKECNSLNKCNNL